MSLTWLQDGYSVALRNTTNYLVGCPSCVLDSALVSTVSSGDSMVVYEGGWLGVTEAAPWAARGPLQALVGPVSGWAGYRSSGSSR